MRARAADSCQPVFDAMTKIVTASSHSYKEALEKWPKFGANELNLALCSYHLGQNAASQGEYKEAISYYHKALPMLQRTFGNESPQLYGILADYSNALKKENRWLEALPMTAWSRNIGPSR